MRLTSFAFLLATAAVLPMPLAAQETIGQQVVATDAANSAERPIAFAAQAPADAALLVMLGSGELPAGLPLTAAERDAVIAAIASGGFTGKSGEVLSLRGVGSRPRILLAGTGEAPNAVAIRDAAGKAAQDLRSEKSPVAILGAGSGAAMAEAALGYALGQYRFDRYKTGAKTPPPGAAVTIVGDGPDVAKAAWDARHRGIAEGTRFARDLVTEPAGVVWPQTFADRTRAAFAGVPGVTVEAAEDDAGCLMVVAHNPGVHLLAVEYLVEGAASPAVLDRMSGGFPPGAAAIFTVDAAGRCTFEGFIQPRDPGGE